MAFKIGPITIPGQAVLAPLAGINQLPFRLLCRRMGAALVYSEMLSCHGLMRNQPNTLAMLSTTPEEKPVSFQLFGADPEVMAAATRKLAERGADIVDLNFGCPVPKVVRHLGGSALLQHPERLAAIVRACVTNCPVPVTVKIRIGWDAHSINAPEIARACEEAGAAAIAVHGRTRSQRFEGRADWDAIRTVVAHVRIPVLGNGDIWTAEDAKRMLETTGCAAVMVGRGALGRPWIFQQIHACVAAQPIPPDPEMPERVAMVREHFAGLKLLHGPRTARLEMRKHTAWYMRGLPGAAEIRRAVNSSESEEEFLAILDSLVCVH
jgi:nifR3 family TIM-barrel protein